MALTTNSKSTQDGAYEHLRRFAATEAIRTPVFFYSISSVKSNNTPLEYLEILNALGASSLLVSAYDVYHDADAERLFSALETAKANGTNVLLDSGNYESYWHRDREWNVGAFHEILTRTKCSLAFTFDDQTLYTDTDVERNARQTISAWERDAAVRADVACPVVHAEAPIIADVCALVAKHAQAPFIAVAERELGFGITQRAKTMLEIRRRLQDRLEHYQPIHVLGTGNPISILMLAACGADSFDGLEWCQTVVNHDNALLYHQQQYDFFRHQTEFGSDGDLSFLGAVAGHNVLFWTRWMNRIQAQMEEGSLIDMLVEYVPHTVLRDIENSYPDAFKGFEQ